MGLETIPLSVFLAQSSKPVVGGLTLLSIQPSVSTLSLVDYGLTFFVGTGVTLLGLVIAEKFGFNVNKGAVRWTVRLVVAAFILWAIFTSGFLTHVMFGY